MADPTLPQPLIGGCVAHGVTIKACKSAGLGYSETQRILEHMRVHGEVPNADAQRLVRYANWDLLGLVPTFMQVTRLHTL